MAFDKERSFDLLDCEEEEGVVVRIKKTRWMKRSKVLLTSLPLNTVFVPDEVVGLFHLGPKSENIEGRQQWEQAIQSPGTPCTKWFPLN